MDKEIWKDLGKKYSCRYQVSNKGRVRTFGYWRVENYRIVSSDKFKILKPYYNEKVGYYYISLGTNRKARFLLHRLVFETFIKKIPARKVVNHKNGRKKDNRLSNLECVTKGEDLKHAWKTGLRKRNWKL